MAIPSGREDKRTVRVGVLHSLSGTMAISEARLKEVILMAIEEINAAGGILGRTVEPIVEDPASDWGLYAEKSNKLLIHDRVAAVFGCWTSVSRRSVLPVFERNNGLLFYPLQYEGEECSRNIIYSGATINQQATPGVDYLMSTEGGGRKKFYLLGTDYVYPRTTNKILRMYLTKIKGVPESSIGEEYTPFGHQDYRTIVARIRSFAATGDAAVINTINGDSNVGFFKELGSHGLTADRCPVMSFSVSEVLLQTLDIKLLVGHLASWNYFMSLQTPENVEFVKAYKQWAKKRNIPDTQAVVGDPMMQSYVNVHLWASAVRKAGSTDVGPVLTALGGLEVASPAGKYKVDEKNHHTWKPVYIGRIRPDGQFDIVWRSSGRVAPEPWSPLTHPGRGCDWSNGGHGTFDTVAGARVWVSETPPR